MSFDVWIDNKGQVGEGALFTKTCPAYGTLSFSGHEASPTQVQRALVSASKAFEDWSLTPLSHRISILEGYAKAVRARREPMALAISRDMGKPLWEALTEVDAMAAKVAISIKAQDERAGNRTTEAPFGHMQLNHRPHGVMAVFGPFNFPGHLANGHIVPALLAGNTCVFKPSELAPSVAILMAEAFAEAGLPEGCLNIVMGGRTAGAALLSGRIDGLLFTGSFETGAFFHRHFAGRPDIILALEMGGNNPIIAWPDDSTDLEALADIVLISGYISAGQRCSCARRLIVPDSSLGEEALKVITDRIGALTLGAYDEPGHLLGPLVDQSAVDKALAFEADLVSKGAAVRVGLMKPDRDGAFLRPGLIDVTTATDVPDKELFGPLLQIKRVGDLDQAIKAANDTRFGLSAGVITDDQTVWDKCYQSLKAGVLTRNRPTAGAPSHLPFGGPGDSGNHRPSAFYAADYCAWPQALQMAQRAVPQAIAGFSGSWR